MESSDQIEPAAPNEGASLRERAGSIFQRLRLVAQLMREAPPAPGARLLWRDGGGVVRACSVGKGILIGRDASCEIVLTQARVSRRHCRVWVEQDQAWVEDLNSSIGVVLNGQPASRQQLKEGDLLDIGGTLLAWLSGK